MADGQQNQGGQEEFTSNDFFLKQQATRMLNAIQKGYNDDFPGTQQNNQQIITAHFINSQPAQQQEQQNPQMQAIPNQSQVQVQQQQQQQQNLQQQLQQVQQAQQQFQQMQQIAQMQSFPQYTTTSNNMGNVNVLVSQQALFPARRGRKTSEKRKRRRHTWVKRPTTAYLYFVSKYRETLKEAGEIVPKAKIITQACAEKWRNMTIEEKEPFLELSRRDRERWEKDKALEKKPRDPNRPKRPPSAYFLFLADFRKKYPTKADPAKEITKKAGEAWNSLSEQEKTPYYKDAQVIRAKWERDLENYKQAAIHPDSTGLFNRSSSVDSDPSHMEMASDGSPLQASPTQQSELPQINPSMLQESGMLEIPEEQSFSDKSQSCAGSSTDGAAMTSSFVYPQVGVLAKDAAGMQFPGR